MQTLETTVILRKARMWDVFESANTKRLGQPFWVKSKETGKFDNRAYLVERSTSTKELQAWVENGQLYVPASDLEIKDFKQKQKTTATAA